MKENCMTSFEPPQDGTPSSFLHKSQLAVGETQAEFDLEFYHRILSRNADHVDALRQQVELLARMGDFQTALELDERLVQLVPTDSVARYNLACSLSMLGRIEEAISALDTAISLGYSDLAHLDADADLDPLREFDEFYQMLGNHGII